MKTAKRKPPTLTPVDLRKVKELLTGIEKELKVMNRRLAKIEKAKLETVSVPSVFGKQCSHEWQFCGGNLYQCKKCGASYTITTNSTSTV